jgi:hypothetical protein
VLQIGLVLIGVVPSGAAMAFYAESTTAGSGFFVLALLTGWAAGKGWYAIACQRSLTQHQRWMTRCTLLLFSALILRIMGGLATIAELNPSTAYAAAAWASWALPCLGYEWFCRQRRLASLEQRSTEALAQAAFGPTK